MKGWKVKKKSKKSPWVERIKGTGCLLYYQKKLLFPLFTSLFFKPLKAKVTSTTLTVSLLQNHATLSSGLPLLYLHKASKNPTLDGSRFCLNFALPALFTKIKKRRRRRSSRFLPKTNRSWSCSSRSCNINHVNILCQVYEISWFKTEILQGSTEMRYRTIGRVRLGNFLWAKGICPVGNMHDFFMNWYFCWGMQLSSLIGFSNALLLLLTWGRHLPNNSSHVVLKQHVEQLVNHLIWAYLVTLKKKIFGKLTSPGPEGHSCILW